MESPRSKNLASDRERRCKDLGIPLTVQRRAVLQSLFSRTDHPTPDDVYEDVRARHPGISRGTVYRTLDTLAGLGLIVRVSHPGSAARYDAHTGRHHHLVCDGCGAMRDLEDPDLDRIKVPKRAGFQVLDYSVHFRGLCAACGRSPRPGRTKQGLKRKRRTR